MSVVIADTSPLNYLVLIGAVEVLTQLYGQIHVPAEVVTELVAPGAPAEVYDWIRSRPQWLTIETVAFSDADPSLARLDAGERAAIHLALQSREALLVIDELLGRQEAAARRIQTIGTLGVIRLAAIRGFLDLPTVLGHLRRTNFRVSDSLVEGLLSEDRRRKLKTKE